MTVRDINGGTISNATVYVKTMNKIMIFGSDRAEDFSAYSGKTDKNGCAQVPFNCKNGHFTWWVAANGYYDSPTQEERFEGREVLTTPIIRYKFEEHEKVSEVKLWPKRNVTRKYIYSAWDIRGKPNLIENGRYAFDLERFDWLPPHGGGKTADFIYVREREDSDFLMSLVGKDRRKAFIPHPDGRDYPQPTSQVAHLEFPNGGGWYIAKKIVNQPIETTYDVMTNDFRTGVLPVGVDTRILGDDEYMVIRSRVNADAGGGDFSAHYSLRART